jgi:tetratricopeptide (TPR) repeat protein
VTRASVVVGVALASFAGLLYVNALHNPFVYDDYRLVVENTSILNLQDLHGVVTQDMTRPLVNLSYALDVIVWGQQPFGFHLTSVLLHMLNVGLLFALTWRLAEDCRRHGQQLFKGTSSLVVAAVAAVLLAAHPLMTQAVGYISGRSEVLYAALFLSAFLCARHWMLHGGARWWFAAAGLWVLSLLAKETAIMLPAALLCYEHLVLQDSPANRRGRLLALHLPLMVSALVVAVARVTVLNTVEYPDQPGGDWRFALIAIDVVWRYAWLLAVPRGQSIFHEIPPIESPYGLALLLTLLGLGAFVALVWRLRTVQSLIAFGCAWFVLLLVPSGVLFALGRGEPMAEHRVYGASMGLFLVAGAASGLLWRRLEARGLVWRTVLCAVSALFVAQLAGRTIVRNAIWSDPVMLSHEAVTSSPGHWMPRVLLGEALRTTGRCSEAEEAYQDAIELQPQMEFGYTKLAACLIELGRLEEAAAVFERLAAVSPLSTQASTGSAMTALLRNRPDDGRRHLLATLERDPSNPQGRELLAFVDGTLEPGRTALLCAAFKSMVPGFALGRCSLASGPTSHKD